MSEVTITTARRHRGAVLNGLTSIEKDVAKLEGKRMLRPSDQRRIKRLLEQVKEDDREFKECLLDVLNFIEEEDCGTLEAEERAYDSHGSRVTELRERLEELEEVEKTESPPTTATSQATATDHSGNLLKRLRYLEQEKTAIMESTEKLPSEPVPHTCLCLHEKCQ